MAAACFARSSLPVPLLPLSLKRLVPCTAAIFPVARRPTPHPMFTFATSRKLSVLRAAAERASDEDAAAPKSVPASVAHEMVQAGYRYLDVRTMEEFNGGHPVGATNIPYMFKTGSGMTKNPNFLNEVSSVFSKDDKIVVGCLSGKRSLMAATDLSSAGFSEIMDVAGGYSAWLQSGLPITQ